MNKYVIELHAYDKDGVLKFAKEYLSNGENPCTAQIDLLWDKVVMVEGIQLHKANGGCEYSVKAINNWIYRTHSIKLIHLLDAY